MNNKFKRFNKILMMTVAILLCFVLISTSVVSGIFAKYVITRSAGATVSLKAFGLTLKVDGATKTNIATKATSGTLNSTAVEVAMTINLAPGETAPDALKISIEGSKASVKTNLKITVKETRSNFDVPTSISGASKSQDYIPIRMTAYTKNGDTSVKAETEILPYWTVVATGTSIQNDIASKLKSNLGFTSVSTNTVTYLLCNANSAPNITVLNLGFYCPDNEIITDSTEAITDKIQTHLGTKTTLPQMVLTFTISLEQVVS